MQVFVYVFYLFLYFDLCILYILELDELDVAKCSACYYVLRDAPDSVKVPFQEIIDMSLLSDTLTASVFRRCQWAVGVDMIMSNPKLACNCSAIFILY